MTRALPASGPLLAGLSGFAGRFPRARKQHCLDPRPDSRSGLLAAVSIDVIGLSDNCCSGTIPALSGSVRLGVGDVTEIVPEEHSPVAPQKVLRPSLSAQGGLAWEAPGMLVLMRRRGRCRGSVGTRRASALRRAPAVAICCAVPCVAPMAVRVVHGFPDLC